MKLNLPAIPGERLTLAFKEMLEMDIADKVKPYSLGLEALKCASCSTRKTKETSTSRFPVFQAWARILPAPDLSEQSKLAGVEHFYLLIQHSHKHPRNPATDEGGLVCASRNSQPPARFVVITAGT